MSKEKKNKLEPESKYLYEELVGNAQSLFSVSPEVVVGALHYSTAKEITVSGVRKLIKDFLERKVV